MNIFVILTRATGPEEHLMMLPEGQPVGLELAVEPEPGGQVVPALLEEQPEVMAEPGL